MSIHRQSETPFDWSPSASPFPRQDEPSQDEPGPSQERKYQRRVRYTPELKLKLMQLCVEYQDRYLEMNSIDDFFRFIRTQFAPHAGIEPIIGDGVQLRQKVKSMIADRQAAIARQKLQSGVAIAATDLDQAVDLWIELAERRKMERESKPTISAQAEEEKERAAIIRENLVKTLSDKRTFQEVSSIDVTEKDTKRDKRRKTGEAWAKGKEREQSDRGDALFGLITEMVSSVNKVTASLSVPPATSSANAATSSANAATTSATTTTSSSLDTSIRLDVVEMELQEMRHTQEASSADIVDIREAQQDIRASQQEILVMLMELRKRKD